MPSVSYEDWSQLRLPSSAIVNTNSPTTATLFPPSSLAFVTPSTRQRTISQQQRETAQRSLQSTHRLTLDQSQAKV